MRSSNIVRLPGGDPNTKTPSQLSTRHWRIVPADSALRLMIRVAGVTSREALARRIPTLAACCTPRPFMHMAIAVD